MMEVSQPPPPPPELDEFLQTSRTGRRNAVPEIEEGEASTAKAAVASELLPAAFEELTCQDDTPEGSADEPMPSTSSSCGPAVPKPSENGGSPSEEGSSNSGVTT